MRKSLLRRPSPAGAIAFVALLLALAGSAYAGSTLGKNSVGTKQLKNGAVTNKKLANGAVGTAKLSSSAVINNANHANSANLANSATNATNATNATHASTADSATTALPRLYGFIREDGTLDTNRSRGIAASSAVNASGLYCVTPASSTGINITTEFPVVSGDEVSGAGVLHSVEFRNLSTPCTTPAGPGWELETFDVADGETPFAFSIIAP